jgi:hypothetical protein
MISEDENDKYLSEVLEILQKRLPDGDKWALLYAIRQCLLLKRPLPEWLRLAFLRAYDSATGYEIKSWDDAFGRPHAKGTHLQKERRKLQLRFDIIRRIKELASEMPIDERLFEKVGKELGIGGSTTVKDIYYEERRKFDEMENELEQIADQLDETSDKN